MAMLRLRWRFFWSRRSATRTVLALVLALVALLSSLYLAFPAIGQRQILDGLLAALQGVAALGAESLLAIVIVTCFACSLALIFVPSYRHHSYLATTPSIIPPVSVYLDAENQLSTSTIPSFTDYLIKRLDGRRADLLYFLDASLMSIGPKYKTLYRFGFRPVDVPHDPTGTSTVKEAVDRELAMHAYERALLGPPGQEFIIVTGDADFVPLIYRLVALRHRVQIWATPIREAYRVVEDHLDIKVIDLSQVISEPDGVAALAQPGEKQFFYAVAETVAAHAEAERMSPTDDARNGTFRSLMRRANGQCMAGVGYSEGNWLDYWLEHLIILGVLQKAKGLVFPQRGSTTEEGAARSLFALSLAAAKEAVAIGAAHEDGLVRMKEVAAALARNGSSLDDGAATLLRRVTANSGRRIASSRYFVRSARALRLLQFEDVPQSLDIIAHPRLPDSPPAPNAVDTAPDTTPHPPLDPPPTTANDETV